MFKDFVFYTISAILFAFIVIVSMAISGCGTSDVESSKPQDPALAEYNDTVDKIERTYQEKCSLVTQTYNIEILRIAKLRGGVGSPAHRKLIKERDDLLKDLRNEHNDAKHRTWAKYKAQALKGITGQ